MKIFNVRLGLATNSSSSHSLIFLKEGVEALDYSGHPVEILEQQDGDFGWQRFTAASSQIKLRYLAVMLKDRLYHELPTNIAQIICKNWLDNVEINEDDYIDHQSWYFLPNAFGTNLPDKDFFEALKTYFLNDRLVILGGNDNSESIHTLDDGSSFKLPLPQDVGHADNYACRYDTENDFWTVFNPSDGRKLRFRLTTDPQLMNIAPTKASAPELIDIKITDYCPFNCKFCYQSSTIQGKHCNSWDIYNLAQDLAILKVFEVAIGGGEPTLHPQFEEILRYFREAGIVPNFTTKNLHWLRDPKKWINYLKYCGAFAYSPSDKNDIRELSTLLEYNGIEKNRANIHLVIGTMDKYVFEQMINTCGDEGLSVTLLGYKRHGFGQNVDPIPYHWWIEIIKTRYEAHSYGPNVSVDTVLAKEYEQQILEADVPRWLFDTEDGKFSCYIDAVANKIGPSSYCDESKMISMEELQKSEDYTTNAEMVKKVFTTF